MHTGNQKDDSPILYTVYGVLYIRTINCTYIPLLNAIKDPVVEHNDSNVMPETVNGDGTIDQRTFQSGGVNQTIVKIMDRRCGNIFGF